MSAERGKPGSKEQTVKLLVKANEKLLPPNYVDRLAPTSEAPVTPEYIAFLNGNSDILKTLYRAWPITVKAMSLGGMYDYSGIHTLAKSIAYYQTAIPCPVSALSAEYRVLGGEYDKALKKEISAGVYKDIMDFEKRLHEVSNDSYSAALTQYESYARELKKHPPKSNTQIEKAMGILLNQSGQFQSLQGIPGNRSVAARAISRKLDQDIEGLLAAEEKRISGALFTTSKKKQDGLREIANSKLTLQESRMNHQIGELRDPISLQKRGALYDNPLGRHVEQNIDTLVSLQKEVNALNDQMREAQSSKHHPIEALSLLYNKSKLLTDKIYLEQEKMDVAVADAYQDVSKRIETMSEFAKKNLPKTKEELGERITIFQSLRSELEQVKDFSGPHISDATTKLREMDQNLGQMHMELDKTVAIPKEAAKVVARAPSSLSQLAAVEDRIERTQAAIANFQEASSLRFQAFITDDKDKKSKMLARAEALETEAKEVVSGRGTSTIPSLDRENDRAKQQALAQSGTLSSSAHSLNAPVNSQNS